MKKSIIILGIIAFVAGSCFGQANNKQTSNNNNIMEKVDITGHWRIDEVIGMELIDERYLSDEFVIQEIREDNNFYGGSQVEFKSDMSFESFYRTRGGEDAHYNVTGTYQWIDDNHIRIHIGKIDYRGGMWEGFKTINENPNVDLGVYIVVKTNNGFNLVKTASDEADAQQLSYSALLHNLPEINTGGSSGLMWIKLDPYNRDTDKLKILNKGLAADGRYDPVKAKLVFSRKINGEVLAFVFRYEEKSIAAFYSAGPEIFAIMDDGMQPPLDVFTDGTGEFLMYLISMERDERTIDANLPPKKDKYEDVFLRCEILTNYYNVEKGVKREIFTLHYQYEDFYDPKNEASSSRYVVYRRMELSQILKHGTVVQNDAVDKNSWEFVEEWAGYDIEEETISMEILFYYGENEDNIPVLQDK
jgi:hypothetical protein